MKWLIALFIILFIAVWLGLAIQTDPGYVLIVYHRWSIETTFWVGLFLLLLLYVILAIVLHFVSTTLTLSKRFHSWKKNRYKQKARRLTNKGLCELAEGNWVNAERTLIRAAEYTDAALINYLAAARAAQGQGAYEKRDEYLKRAAECADEAEVAVGLTQAQLQLDSKQLEKALATLMHLNDLVPHHTYVLKLLQGVYLELNDYENLRRLLPELQKTQVLKPHELEQLEQKIYLALLNKAIQHPDATPEMIEKVWRSIPRAWHHYPDSLLAFTNYLIDHQKSAEAELLIKEALKKHWDSRLIRQYAFVESSKPAKQVALAEYWLKIQGQDPALLLCLGRLYSREGLWGKAKNCLQTALKLDPTPETYQELGKILEQLHEKNAALEYYRRGLELSCNTSYSRA